MKILLGSNSPRRKELLENLGLKFDTVAIDCDEVYPEHIPVDKIAGYLSELKSKAYKSLNKNEVLLTADTIVVLEDEVLGKPKDREEAAIMLKNLSGKSHEVYTAFTLQTKEKTVTRTDVAQVDFYEISREEINFYIQNHRPFDKAGSYGVQEWLGMTKIKSIKGSFYTIMGLPTHLIYSELKDLGINDL